MISVDTTLAILGSVPRRHARYLLEQAVFHPKKWRDVARSAVAVLVALDAVGPAPTLDEPVVTTAGAPVAAMSTAHEGVIAVDQKIEDESPEYLERGEDCRG